MAMQGKMGEAQEGGAGMRMGGAHAQHGVVMGAEESVMVLIVRHRTLI